MLKRAVTSLLLALAIAVFLITVASAQTTKPASRPTTGRWDSGVMLDPDEGRYYMLSDLDPSHRYEPNIVMLRPPPPGLWEFLDKEAEDRWETYCKRYDGYMRAIARGLRGSKLSPYYASFSGSYGQVLLFEDRRDYVREAWGLPPLPTRATTRPEWYREETVPAPAPVP